MIAGIIIAGLMLTGLTAGVITIIIKNRPTLAKENIPARLGVLDGVPIQPLLDKLTFALDVDYVEQVKYRFL